MIWFGLVNFYGISTIVCYLMPNPLYSYILNMIWLGLVGFYGILTIVGYLKPNPVYKSFIFDVTNSLKVTFSNEPKPIKFAYN